MRRCRSLCWELVKAMAGTKRRVLDAESDEYRSMSEEECRSIFRSSSVRLCGHVTSGDGRPPHPPFSFFFFFKFTFDLVTWSSQSSSNWHCQYFENKNSLNQFTFSSLKGADWLKRGRSQKKRKPCRFFFLSLFPLFKELFRPLCRAPVVTLMDEFALTRQRPFSFFGKKRTRPPSDVSFFFFTWIRRQTKKFVVFLFFF